METYCEEGHDICSVKGRHNFNEIATKTYACKQCRSQASICSSCGFVCKYSSTMFDHILDDHNGTHGIFVETNEDVFYLTVEYLPGLEHLLYLECGGPEMVSQESAFYPKKDRYDALMSLYEKVYSCIFCEAEFECLPTKELFNSHLKKCPGLITLAG